MTAKSILLIALSLFGFELHAGVQKKVLVVCSSSAGKTEGFHLANFNANRDSGAGMHNTASGELRYVGTYDQAMERLRVNVFALDEEGEEKNLVAKLDAKAPFGEHVRMVFANPTSGSSEKTELVELVCNILKH